MPLSRIHTFTAKQYLSGKNYISKKNQDSFLLGVTFPDIRDNLKIDRRITHLPIENINKLQEVDTYFLKGVYFHSLVDNIWTDIFSKHKDSKNTSEEGLAMKLVTEKFTPVYVLPMITENDILEIQDSFNIDRQMILKWYRIVSLSLRSNDSLKSSQKMLEYFPHRNKDLVFNYYRKYENSKDLKDIYKEFITSTNITFIHV